MSQVDVGGEVGAVEMTQGKPWIPRFGTIAHSKTSLLPEPHSPLTWALAESADVLYSIPFYSALMSLEEGRKSKGKKCNPFN